MFKKENKESLEKTKYKSEIITEKNKNDLSNKSKINQTKINQTKINQTKTNKINTRIKSNKNNSQKEKNIQGNIKIRLKHFISIKKIPHIIFHGPSGSGKHTILFDFINELYKGNKKTIVDNVMYVNCAHTKGIRFIRDELKFFAKTNIQITDSILFKSIVLFNADKLTVDAQSALRRCIEQFSNNTRFFIIVENKDNLLKPILSRFCDIYIPYSKYNTTDKNKKTNDLTSYYSISKTQYHNEYDKERIKKLRKYVYQKKNYINLESCNNLAEKLYNLGYSGIDILELIKNEDNIKEKYLFLIYFNKIKKEFRNDKILIFIILYFVFMRKNIELENILTF